MEGLDAMGFEKTTPVQEKAIPVILEGKDLVACAQTGTGKTAAYLLPVIDQILRRPDENIKTLIIAPTRELALQIDQQVEGFAYFCPVGSIPVYGGGDGGTFDQQKSALIKGTDIVIATPGKLLSHLNLGYVNMDQLRHLILDEADRMLDMGFYDDIMRIISFLPEQRQTLLFSATMPPKIRDLSKKILVRPERIDIAISKPAEGILQGAYSVYDTQKLELIKHLFKEKEIPSSIIFSSTKSGVKQIEAALKKMGFKAKAIHSDLTQEGREAVLNEFRAKQINILVATDIVSRGIDIKDISLILNYDVPQDAEDYVHRIGRTARAESTGVALTFINESEQWKFRKIEQLIEKDVNKIPLPVHLGEGPVYGSKPARSGKPPFKRKGGKPRYFKKGKGRKKR